MVSLLVLKLAFAVLADLQTQMHGLAALHELKLSVELLLLEEFL